MPTEKCFLFSGTPQDFLLTESENGKKKTKDKHDRIAWTPSAIPGISKFIECKRNARLKRLAPELRPWT